MRQAEERTRMAHAPDISVRSATVSDVESVRAFWLSVFEQDYGYGYRPEWHWDYDDIPGVYLHQPRHALMLAHDGHSGELVGTAALRSGPPRSPGWLVERYQPPEETAQLYRVFTHHGYRGRGVARRLVEALRSFAVRVGGYRRICLHTETAVNFWLGLGCTVVHDGRTADPPDATVHMELPLHPHDSKA